MLLMVLAPASWRALVARPAFASCILLCFPLLFCLAPPSAAFSAHHAIFAGISRPAVPGSAGTVALALVLHFVQCPACRKKATAQSTQNITQGAARLVTTKEMGEDDRGHQTGDLDSSIPP